MKRRRGGGEIKKGRRLHTKKKKEKEKRTRGKKDASPGIEPRTFAW